MVTSYSTKLSDTIKQVYLSRKPRFRVIGKEMPLTRKTNRWTRVQGEFKILRTSVPPNFWYTVGLQLEWENVWDTGSSRLVLFLLISKTWLFICEILNLKRSYQAENWGYGGASPRARSGCGSGMDVWQEQTRQFRNPFCFSPFTKVTRRSPSSSVSLKGKDSWEKNLLASLAI